MSTAGQKFMTELSTQSIEAANAPSSSGTKLLPCPFCGCEGQKFKDFWDSGEIDCFGCKDCAISFERAEEWNARPGGFAQPSSGSDDLRQLAVALRANTVKLRFFRGATYDGFADEYLSQLTRFIDAVKPMLDVTQVAKEPEGIQRHRVMEAALREIAFDDITGASLQHKEIARAALARK